MLKREFVWLSVPNWADYSFRKALGAGGKATQPLWSMQEVEGKMGFALYGTDGYDPRKS
jgi:hypothetical protein